MMGATLAIVPTYNEIDNVESIIRAVLELSIPVEVLIVDDNSPDGTGTRVKALQAQYPGRLHLLERPGKQGLGTAYLAGFHWAVAREYSFVCELDADFSHNPKDIPRLVQACEAGADVAVGSRYVTGVNVVNWPFSRILMSLSASKYVRIVSGMPIKDATAGFVCYRQEVLRTLLGYPIRMRGYGFQIEMKYLAYKLGFRVVEVPIIFIDRKRGSSKMSGGIFNEALWGVIRMRLLAPRRI